MQSSAIQLMQPPFWTASYTTPTVSSSPEKAYGERKQSNRNQLDQNTQLVRQNYTAERRASPGQNNPGMVGEIIGIRNYKYIFLGGHYLESLSFSSAILYDVFKINLTPIN
jgi:hypothetical protein